MRTHLKQVGIIAVLLETGGKSSVQVLYRPLLEDALGHLDGDALGERLERGLDPVADERELDVVLLAVEQVQGEPEVTLHIPCVGMRVRVECS